MNNPQKTHGLTHGKPIAFFWVNPRETYGVTQSVTHKKALHLHHHLKSKSASSSGEVEVVSYYSEVVGVGL